MRKGVLAILGVVALLGGWAAWRSPTAALVSLKLALDRRDLSGVERALDYRALADSALARLVDGRPEEPTNVALVLRGESSWVPAMSSARTYLRMRLERVVERLVEDPEHAADVTWEDLRRALSSLRRAGSVARFRLPGRNGEEYVVRMRQADGRWRIVAIDRDGEPVLLGPADREPPAIAENGNAAQPETEVAEEGMAEAHLGALVDEASELARAHPRPRSRSGTQRPFLRKLHDGTWAVQVASTVDEVDADMEREWLDSAGEPAFVEEAEVRGRIWRRVLVGRYPTRAGAEEALARLTPEHTATGEPTAIDEYAATEEGAAIDSTAQR